MEEIWKDIPEYEGIYQVSNLGRIRSLSHVVFCKNKHTRICSGKILNPSPGRYEYLLIVLSKNNKKKTYRVNRLVALVFCDGYEKHKVVNHKNEIKTDNRAENLEWVTCKENTHHGNCISKISKKHNKPVVQYDKNGNFIAEYESAKIASIITGIERRDITACRLGKLKSAGGYIWRFPKGYINNK